MTELAQRLGRMSPSGTAAVFRRVAELRAKGIDIVSLSLGEPDFATPPHIVAAAADAMRRGETRYTDVPGRLSLREAIAEDSYQRRGVRHDAEQVIVSTGAKHVLYNLAQVLYNSGDRVLVPTPCWGSYVEQARLCGAEAVLLPGDEDNGFVPSLQMLASALATGAKALVLCTPSNPTGAVLERDYLLALAELLRQHDCFVILDEIYAHLRYGTDSGVDSAAGLGGHVSLLSVAPDLRERLLVVDGVSKAYAMTGFRVGWLLGPSAVVAAVGRLQGQCTTHVATMCQAAAEAALRGDQACIEPMRVAYQERRDRLLAGLANIAGFKVRVIPQGAFYVFADVRELYGCTWTDSQQNVVTLQSDEDVAFWLLETARVATVPGAAFFGPGYLRLSYATDSKLIDEAVARIARAVANLGAAN